MDREKAIFLIDCTPDQIFEIMSLLESSVIKGAIGMQVPRWNGINIESILLEEDDLDEFLDFNEDCEELLDMIGIEREDEF